MARALANSGRHEIRVYHGPAAGSQALREAGLEPAVVSDLEEVLADPAIEAVIVAGMLAERAGQLRRALQSERHCLCVHPLADSPDPAYESAMIQADTHKLLVPLLPELLHPDLRNLAELTASPQLGLGSLVLIEMRRCPDPEMAEAGSLRGWETLRALGGEIAEVAVVGPGEELGIESPVLVSGRFERGALFQITYLQECGDGELRIQAVGREGKARVQCGNHLDDPCHVEFEQDGKVSRTEPRPSWDPWKALVEEFENMLAGRPGLVSWQAETRCLELDDAARRSLAKRRVSALEYPEATEEAGFKGTMTLVGCALLWGIIAILIASVWLPWLGWLIVPALGFFLGLQVFRWFLPRTPEGPVPPPEGDAQP